MLKKINGSAEKFGKILKRLINTEEEVYFSFFMTYWIYIFRPHKRYLKFYDKIQNLDEYTKNYVYVRGMESILVINMVLKVIGIISLFFGLASFVRNEINPYGSGDSVDSARSIVIAILFFLLLCGIIYLAKASFEYFTMFIREYNTNVKMNID